MNYTLQLIKVIAVLGSVLSLFYLVMKFVRKYRFNNQAQQIQILDRCHLTANHVIYLLQIVDKIWLVKSTQDNLEFIQQLEIDQAELQDKGDNQLVNLFQKGKDEEE
ncbi:flagellar biosynthetic protein FliO [Halanaerobaculum tunisiense]